MRLFLAALILSLSAAVATPAGAQPVDIVGPHNPYCGMWQNGVFVPNGNCIEETTTTVTTTTTPERPEHMMGRVRGTIIGVRGHLVTIQQSSQTLVVNDTPALASDSTGRVAVGRQVVAHGYWQDGTFYVTRME